MCSLLNWGVNRGYLANAEEVNEFVIRNSNINDVTIVLEALYVRDTVVITSRRRREVLQERWLIECLLLKWLVKETLLMACCSTAVPTLYHNDDLADHV